MNTYSIDGRVAYKKNGNKTHVSIEVSPDVIQYYRWFIDRKWAWMTQKGRTILDRNSLGDNKVSTTNQKIKVDQNANLNVPLHSAHITVVHANLHKVTNTSNWNKRQNQKVRVQIIGGVISSYCKKRDGYWVFLLRAKCKVARTIRDELGVKVAYKHLHITIGNTKNI